LYREEGSLKEHSRLFCNSVPVKKVMQ